MSLGEVCIVRRRMDELELERQRRIRENRQRLNELQLTELAKDLAVENHAQGGVHPARSDSICELAQIKFKQFETPYVQPGCFQTEDVASYRTTASGSRRSLYAGDDTQKKARKREKKEKKENEPPAAPTRASRRMQGIAADLPVGLGMGGAIDAKLDVRAPASFLLVGRSSSTSVLTGQDASPGMTLMNLSVHARMRRSIFRTPEGRGAGSAFLTCRQTASSVRRSRSAPSGALPHAPSLSRHLPHICQR